MYDVYKRHILDSSHIYTENKTMATVPKRNARVAIIDLKQKDFKTKTDTRHTQKKDILQREKCPSIQK